MNTTYFQDELRYLREVGPEFARANPQLARFLADRGADPDVERLLEGVAFLCGRIRHKLDDELPELTANLMSLLWPHYLRPIPSMSIIEMLPDLDAMQAPLDVAAGVEFASVPVEGTRCRYRAAWPVQLRPWMIEDVRLEATAAQPLRLALRFRASPKVPFDKLSLDTVRLHLAGDPRAAFTLFMLLSANVESITVGTGAKGAEVPLPPAAITPAGLDRKEAVLPYPARSFAGYRLLQEYFAFKERFLFVDVRGLDRAVAQLSPAGTLELIIAFNRRLESFPLVSRENVRLHCVPVINLFAHDADPIRVQHERGQYIVQPSRTGVADRRHLEVYSVDRVFATPAGAQTETQEYQPFFSFGQRASTGAFSRYYQLHVTPNLLGGDPRMGTDTWISFVMGDRADGPPPDATVSLEMTCTNRHLPAALRAGDISQPTDTSPPGTRFRNLSKPTPTIAPPLGRALHWRLISHLSLNYVSLADTDHFKELLRVYDFQSEHDAQTALAQQRLLDGIVAIRTIYGERLMRGAPVRGVLVDVQLNEDHFAGEGDAYLFTLVLERFLCLYTTINAYTELTARFTRSGQRYAFAPRWGEQPTPATTGAVA